jgi:aldehyde dehydrogenase (NAD+)
MASVLAATETRHDLPLLIGGDEIWGVERFDVRYPYTGEVIGSAPKLTPAQVAADLDDAVDLRFDLSRHERAQILNQIADHWQAEEADFARLITLESGLCLKDTSYELRLARVMRRQGCRTEW